MAHMYDSNSLYQHTTCQKIIVKMVDTSKVVSARSLPARDEAVLYDSQGCEGFNHVSATYRQP